MVMQAPARAAVSFRPPPFSASAFPPALAPIAALIFLGGGFGPNSDLALVSVFALVLGGGLLWRPGESPILLLVFVFQWLQSSVAVFHANWLGIDVASYSEFGGSTRLAIELSLVGSLIFATGMRLGAGAPNGVGAVAARQKALAIPAAKRFRLYILAWALAFVASTFAWVVPGLAQPLLALASLKWAAYFMLAYAAFINPRGSRNYFIAAFLFEFAQGIGGFFSDFKTVFLVTLLARAAASVRLSKGAIVVLILLGSTLLGLGIVWTAVKQDFRNYVSGGTDKQIVAVDLSTRLSRLADLVEQLDEQRLQQAADLFARRLSYVEFFGVALDVVPGAAPYAGGAIWMDAVTRPFMPRLFFPEKSSIDDTQRTNLYTRGIAGTYTNTSISLGYIAESYIDFGMGGMMAPIMFFGLLCGRTYRVLQNSHQTSGILGMSLATVVLLPVCFLESSITKTFGAFALSAIVAWAFVSFVAPRWFQWLKAEQ